MNSSKKITVFFPRIDGTLWMGGKLYFENLVNLVQSYYPNVTFFETHFDHSSFFPDNNSLFVRIRRKITGVTYMDEHRNTVREFYRKKAGDSIPVLFSNSVIKETGGIPYLFWIPDFQFMHLKEFASPAYLKSCEANARAGAGSADLVMLSSNDALQDYATLLPEFISKAKVVPFAKKISASFLNQDSIEVISKYKLPSTFFYVSNQFWKHKNHIVVINALKILNERGLKFSVVFSGQTHDARNPTYFEELLEYIEKSKLQQQVFILGLIPYADVVSLIRECVAVINPSKFEGWNSAVEEVKSIGKKMLLSDIAVHHEQIDDEAAFFQPDRPEELAEIMIRTMSVNNFEDDTDNIINAQKEYQLNEQKFAKTFYQLLESSIVK